MDMEEEEVVTVEAKDIMATEGMVYIKILRM